MYEIYLITNQIDEKLYVGQTRRTASLRWSEHVRDSNKGKTGYLLYNAMRKHGANRFALDIISRTDSQEEANRLEKFWIAYLKTSDPSFGYNMTDGGVATVLMSEESKKKKSDKLKDFYSSESNHPQYRKDISTSDVISLRSKNLSLEKIANKLGVGVGLVLGRLRKCGVDTKRVTDAFETEVLKLYPSGVSGAAIAQKMNCSLTKVYNCLRNNSVAVRPRSYRQLPPISENKRCIGCKDSKPLNDFHKNKNRRDGRRNLCKTCVSSYDKQHHAKKTLD